VADVAVIIPAYNEAPRVGAVVRAALVASLPSKVLVVDDGSTDSTAEAAQAAGAHVLSKQNGGKAAAMDVGVRSVWTRAVCFLDADLTTIQPLQIDALIRPWLAGARMVVGMDQRIQRLTWSTFCGPRVMGRDDWFMATMLEPSMLESGYGVEIALAAIANRFRWPVAEVPLLGIEAPTQTQKWGKSNHNAKMWARIMQTAGKVSKGRILQELVQPMLFRHGWVNRWQGT